MADVETIETRYTDKLAYRMKEAERAAGISKAQLYNEIAAGRLKSVKRAGRRLILADDLKAYLSTP